LQQMIHRQRRREWPTNPCGALPRRNLQHASRYAGTLPKRWRATLRCPVVVQVP
jgi:hypothetical protein